MRVVASVNIRPQNLGADESSENPPRGRGKIAPEKILDQLLTRYETSAPRLVEWAETNIPEGLTVFTFPADNRRRIRTSNPLERTNKEIRRRTRVAAIFPNEESCLRLVSAVLMEISEEWETGRVFLSF